MKNKRGFTLIELLATMAIFTILMTSVFSIFINMYKINISTEEKVNVDNENRVELIIESKNNTNKDTVQINVSNEPNISTTDWEKAFPNDINVKGNVDIRTNKYTGKSITYTGTDNSVKDNTQTKGSKGEIYNLNINTTNLTGFTIIDKTSDILNISNSKPGNYKYTGNLVVEDVVPNASKDIQLITSIPIQNSIIIVEGDLYLHGISGSNNDIVISNSLIIVKGKILSNGKWNDLIMNDSIMITMKEFDVNYGSSNDVQNTLNNSIIYCKELKVNSSSNKTELYAPRTSVRLSSNAILLNLLNRAEKAGILSLGEL